MTSARLEASGARASRGDITRSASSHRPLAGILLTFATLMIPGILPAQTLAHTDLGLRADPRAVPAWLEPPEPKSPSRARLYAALSTTGAFVAAGLISPDPSIGATGGEPPRPSRLRTGASRVLMLSGVLFAPSMGSVYAGDWSRTTRGVLTRAGGGALAGTGAVVMLANAFGGRSDLLAGLGAVMLAGGSATVVGSGVYDILISSERSVDEHNEAIRNAGFLSVTPWHPGEGEGVGFRVQVIH